MLRTLLQISPSILFVSVSLLADTFNAESRMNALAGKPTDVQITTKIEDVGPNVYDITATFSFIPEISNRGTAFLYKGYVVTNYHVCHQLLSGHRFDKFQMKNVKTGYFTQPQFVASDKENDVCILKDDKTVALSDPDNLVLNGAVIYTRRGAYRMAAIKKDEVVDENTKNNAYVSNRCMGIGGDSGSPVSVGGKIVGVMWAAQNTTIETEAKPHDCYFVAIENVDKLILDSKVNVLFWASR